MERNPFILSPAIPDEFFCDRQKETALLTKCIANQENVVLTSPRRVGKTGLIYHCFQQPPISAEYHTISIDILNAKRLQELLSYVTEQQKEVLYAIAADRQVERITSADFVRRHHLKSASAVQSATRRLLDYNLITEQGKVFSLSDPLLRIWITR